MAIDNLDSMVFIGRVSVVDATTGTAVVTRPDKAGKTTAPLFVLQRGTAISKDYWMPGIDDQVACLLLPNTSGKGAGAGFILGAIYSNVDQPPTGASERSRVLDHQGDLTIRVSGALSIEAGKMDVKAGDGVISTTGDVVASGVSLRSHTHPGDSGGSTGTPNA